MKLSQIVAHPWASSDVRNGCQCFTFGGQLVFWQGILRGCGEEDLEAA